MPGSDGSIGFAATFPGFVQRAEAASGMPAKGYQKEVARSRKCQGRICPRPAAAEGGQASGIVAPVLALPQRSGTF